MMSKALKGPDLKKITKEELKKMLVFSIAAMPMTNTYAQE